jgi:dipeptidyl aminopeptidase/acylaminoacyl peptidase
VVPEDHFSIGLLNEVVISPKGDFVAYTLATWDKAADNRSNDIWVVPTNGGKAEQWTKDRNGYGNLQWSGDGDKLFFTTSFKHKEDKSAPYGSEQVWAISRASRQLESVTAIEGGVAVLAWGSAANSLLFTTTTEEPTGDWSSLRSRFSTMTYGVVNNSKTTLHRFDVKSKQVTKVAEYAGHVFEGSLSPDGTKLVMVTADNDRTETKEGGTRLTVLDIATGASVNLPDDGWRSQLKSQKGVVSSPSWSGDGEKIAFGVGLDAYPSEAFVYFMNGSRVGKTLKVPRPGHVSLSGGVDGVPLKWRGQSNDLTFLGDDHGRIRLYSAVNIGQQTETLVHSLSDGDVVIESFTWDAGGQRVAANLATSGSMQEVCTCIEKEWTTHTQLNPQASEWKLPEISIVKWTSKDGQRIEGILELPRDRKPGERLPLIVNLHGGPTAASTCNLQLGWGGSVYYASQGYAFFSPNYRGTPGYGDDFIAGLLGHERDIELADITTGIDSLVQSGVANPDAIGVSGLSHGGYLTICLVAVDQRFKAASSGAGMADLVFQWGVSDEPACMEALLGGRPWEARDAYVRASPIFDLAKTRTPIILHVGENDDRCPRGHSDMVFRALKSRGTQTELIIYPKSEHTISSYSGREAKMAWDLAWFDHYLRGKPIPAKAKK